MIAITIYTHLNLAMDIETENLKGEEWYQFTFKRVYEDDGSGQKNDLWFDLVESIIITT